MVFHFYSTDCTYDDGARSFSYSDIETDKMGARASVRQSGEDERERFGLC